MKTYYYSIDWKVYQKLRLVIDIYIIDYQMEDIVLWEQYQRKGAICYTLFLNDVIQIFKNNYIYIYKLFSSLGKYDKQKTIIRKKHNIINIVIWN